MNLFGRWRERRRVDRELADEMLAHREEKVDDLVDLGMSEQEARATVARQFGNSTQQQETSREAWGWNGFEQLLRDVQFGSRMLAKNRGFSVTVILVLALGIGLNTAMFSAVQAVLLSGLPYPHPDRLVQLSEVNTRGRLMNASFLDFEDWRAQSRTLACMAAYNIDDVTVAGRFTPRRIQIGIVTGGFFESLETYARFGRTFASSEQRPGGTPTVVLGYSLAQQLFGTGASGIGNAVRLNGMSFTVIGIMPAGFDFPAKAQAWIAQGFFGDTSTRSAHNYFVVGRLGSRASVGEAQQEMSLIASRLGKVYVDDKGQGIRVNSLYEEMTGPVRPALLVLLAAVFFVLLIACVNISNLQIARATARMRELALRTALGAGRGRLIRQLLTESVLLSLIGGSVGLLLALLGTDALRHFAPADIPRLDNMRVDGAVLWFTAFLSVGAGLLFGVLPALVGSRTGINDALKDGGGKTTAGPHMKTWGRTLVVGQMALAVLLLTGASLLMKSYWKLAHVPSGLQSSQIVTADLSWPTADGNSAVASAVVRRAQSILDQVGRLPGVEAAGFIQPLPVRDAGADGGFEIAGRPLPADPHECPDAYYRLATPGYFKAFGLPILKGRSFDAQDDYSQAQVAIVNQSFAKQFFGIAEVLGQRIRFFGFDRKPQFLEIVGVVPDVRAFGLNKPVNAEVFVDYMQHAGFSMDAALVVRGRVANEAPIRAIIQGLQPDMPIEFARMDDVIAETISRERFQTSLLGLFAGSALLLSAVGIYGLLSYTVTRRTSEMGVRMALGANQKTVLGMVLLEGSKMVAVGLAFGVLGSALLTRLLSSLLYQVETNDGGSFFLSALTFTAIAMLGCYLPAWRASKINPNIALRHE